ncbi:MAG: Crp/Fnr family transcriptional regulator [Hyphomicrobium sp.]|uniref:Crp/Fnr family transcriptional regulator n=1 Tax=Hyphomicrobium sp. TaxID=82 RepID=UPI003D150F18
MAALEPQHLALARATIRFPELGGGAVAYRQGAECPNYVMCIEGGTRTFKISNEGRELLIYKVGAGGTCVFTTQCLLGGGTFPAESVAESPTVLAALPAAAFHRLMSESVPFRRFVLDDYSTLLGTIISLVDEIAFASLEQRLAGRLIAEADAQGHVAKTHQQLALDLGSVREVISRYLGEWERAGWIRTARGRIEIVDRAALASHRGS